MFILGNTLDYSVFPPPHLPGGRSPSGCVLHGLLRQTRLPDWASSTDPANLTGADIRFSGRLAQNMFAAPLGDRDMSQEHCYICGQATNYTPFHGNLREARCRHCGGSRRNSHMAAAIVRVLAPQQAASVRSLREIAGILRNKRIYHTAAQGLLHTVLHKLPGYVCSEFFPGVTPGTLVKDVRCEDLTALTFPNSCFDLVISEDVLEHVFAPERAFREIHRVLKPGGFHLFSVPWHPNQRTQTRAVRTSNGIVHRLPPVYHGDPISASDALVVTDYGRDLSTWLEAFGFTTERVDSEAFYAPEEITWIATEEDHARHLAAIREQSWGAFRYNSHVFVSQAVKLELNGERLVPELRNENTYEHFHRYALAASLALDKVVLDIASGEGYGSAWLADTARSVLGVDRDSTVIAHAQKRYHYLHNLEFREGSCTQIPCSDQAVDLVVSFETLEHIHEHRAFLAECRRVLTHDGTLIISTPNKAIYSDAADYHNPYHAKELTLVELQELLGEFFPHVELFGQQVVAGSWLLPCHQQAVDRLLGLWDAPDAEDLRAPVYFVAVCSLIPRREPLSGSFYAHPEDFLTRQLRRVPQQLSQLHQALRARDQRIQELTNALQRLRSQPAVTPSAPTSTAGAPLSLNFTSPRDDLAVSVIIPVFNQSSLTERCLETLYANTDSEIPFEVVVIDNGSGSDTAHLLQAASRRYPRFQVLRNERNQGFARACNQGAQAAASANLLFLNNDTEPQPDWLKPLFDILQEDPMVAAVGSRLLYPDGTIQFAGALLLNNQHLQLPVSPLLLDRGGPQDLPRANLLRSASIVTGASMLVRRKCFDAVAGFDQGYWNGYEDVDLCIKFQHEGWQIVYQPASVLIHHESKSGPERFAREKENLKRLTDRWHGKVRLDALLTPDKQLHFLRSDLFEPYQPPRLRQQAVGLASF